MSTRAISVKTFNNNKHQHNSGPSLTSSPHVAQSKPAVTKSNKIHNIQQPKKYQNPKVQATPSKNSKRRNNKKVVVSEDESSSSSSSSSSSEDDMMTNKPAIRRNNKRNTSPNFEYKSLVDQVYAGPTFNNAPAPSALPIPAFNARGSPINYPQPLYHSVNPSFQQQSMDLMNLITPQKVVTVYELEKTNLALSEIQRGLRSMLKIES